MHFALLKAEKARLKPADTLEEMCAGEESGADPAGNQDRRPRCQIWLKFFEHPQPL